MHNVIRPQLADLSDTLENARRGDVDVVQAEITKKEQEIQELNHKQNLYQDMTTNTQRDVNRQLVEVAELHAVRNGVISMQVHSS